MKIAEARAPSATPVVTVPPAGATGAPTSGSTGAAPGG
jgi:hypothetical protein